MSLKPRLWYGVVLNLILAALLISGAAIYVAYFRDSPGLGKNRILEIKKSGSGKIYGKWPLENDGEFAVEFVHSVNQDTIRETFKAEGRMIRPVAVRFSSFGAGVLSDLTEGQVLSRDKDGMLITGFTASFKELNYIVGTVSDHLLFINDETLSLRDLCGKNAHITLRIREEF